MTAIAPLRTVTFQLEVMDSTIHRYANLYLKPVIFGLCFILNTPLAKRTWVRVLLPPIESAGESGLLSIISAFESRRTLIDEGNAWI